jgi:hypothetical protein
MSSIDEKLDELRANSAELINSMKDKFDFLHMDNVLTGGTNERVSEAKSRYVTWDHLAQPTTVPIKQRWSDVLPVERGLMDPSKWVSEMQAATSSALAHSLSQEEAPIAAGIAPLSKKPNPCFFAWTLENPTPIVDTADSKNDAVAWERAGDGWKSQDGLYYSDVDLINDVLGEFTGSIGKDDIVIEEVEEVEEQDAYITENNENYAWPLKPEATAQYDPKSGGAEALGISATSDYCSDWVTEYDAQTQTIAFDSEEGPIAGLSSNQGEDKIPMAFSWSRIKKDELPSSPKKVIIGAPYGTMSAPVSKWVTEYDSAYINVDELEPIVEEPDDFVMEPLAVPYGTSDQEAWETEYDDAYALPEEEEEAVEESKGEDDDVVMMQEKPKLSISDAFAALKGSVSPQKAKKSLRFLTTQGTSYAWPKSKSKNKATKSLIKKTKIHYTNEEASEGVLPKLKVTNPCDDWYKYESAELGDNGPVVSEYDSNYTPKDPEDGPEPESKEEEVVVEPVVVVAPTTIKKSNIGNADSEEWFMMPESLCPKVPVVSEFQGAYKSPVTSTKDIEVIVAEVSKPKAAPAQGDCCVDNNCCEPEKDDCNDCECPPEECCDLEVVGKECCVDNDCCAPETNDEPVIDAKKAMNLKIRGKAIKSKQSAYKRPASKLTPKALTQAKKATKDAHKGNTKNSIRSKGGNPLLKNPRYPGQSDTGSRWKSESRAQYIGYAR